MKLIITGGTGLVGRQLVQKLLDPQGKTNSEIVEIQILSRQAENALRRQQPTLRDPRVRIARKVQELDAHNNSYLVNLAGEPIADKRWSDARKKQLVDSRVTLTQKLRQLFEHAKTRPKKIISASAVGYYGYQNQDVTAFEEHSQGHGFSAKLCADWEQAARSFTELAFQTAQPAITIMRLGVVLASPDRGGFLAKMRPLFRLGLGGPIGRGQQWINWIYIDDVVDFIISELVQNDLREDNNAEITIHNLVSNNEIRQKDFAEIYADILNRPSFVPTPAPMMKLAFGEMAEELILNGKRVKTSDSLTAKQRYQDIHEVLQLCEQR